MKSKRWAIAILMVVSFAPALIFGTLSVEWLRSPEFGKDVDCWLDPNDGSWVTLNEAYSIGVALFGFGGLVFSLFLCVVLNRLNAISPKAGWIILGFAVAATIAVYSVNIITNDGYIDRLYEACGRVN